MDCDYKLSAFIVGICEENLEGNTATKTEARRLTRICQGDLANHGYAMVETVRFADPLMTGFQEKFDRQRAARQADFKYIVGDDM